MEASSKQWANFLPRGVVHLKSITQRGWGTRKEKTGMRWWLVVSISLTCVRTCGRSCLPPTRRCNRSFVFPPSSCLREVGHDTRQPVSGSSRQSRAPAPKRTKGVAHPIEYVGGSGGKKAKCAPTRCALQPDAHQRHAITEDSAQPRSDILGGTRGLATPPPKRAFACSGALASNLATPHPAGVGVPERRCRNSAEMLVHRAVGALVVRCQDGKDNAGASHAKKVRRLGRPAWKRSPDDTPLRDGNRDRIQGALWTAMHAARIRLSLPSLTPRGELPTGVAGMLTTAAVKTLLAYTTETNQQLHHWCGPSAHPRVALREPVVVGP